MKISVIIPTYRPGRYLIECLDSLSKQTMDCASFEIIIVLNGEKQGYEDAILGYISSHSRINYVYLYSSISGVSRARNMGLDVARGEYITFIDDDDFVSESYLDELFLKASKDVISLCYPLSFLDGSEKYQKYSITNNYLSAVNNKKQVYTVARKYFSGPVYKLIHRDIIGERRFDTRFKNGEDSLFMFLISDRMRYVDFTSQNAIYYRRIRVGSATSSLGTIARCKVCFKYLLALHSIFWSNPSKYSISFFITRNIGALHALVSK